MSHRDFLTKVAVYLGLMEEPVENLDPRIDHQVAMARLHGLTDDERITLPLRIGQMIEWTDQYGTRWSCRVKAELFEVTHIVRARLADEAILG